MGLIIFYTGYQPACHGDNVYGMHGCGGSEIALIETAQELQKQGHSVKVFSPMYRDEHVRQVNNIDYMNEFDFEAFMQINSVDALIISRYVYLFIAHVLKAKRIFLWMHDLTFISWFDGFEIPFRGSKLVYNMLPSIEKIVFVSEYQKQNFEIVSSFVLPENKCFVIGNGLSNELISKSLSFKQNKIPFSFIWCSNQARGLYNLARLWPQLSSRIKEEFGIQPTLKICGAPCEPLNIDIELLSITYADTVTNYGKITQQNMFDMMTFSHVWFYPTDFHETYCMVAKEAQLAGCICIAPDIGALKETIGDLGTIYPENFNDEQIIQVVIETLKKDIQVKDMISFVSQETWKQRASQWEQIIFH